MQIEKGQVREKIRAIMGQLTGFPSSVPKTLNQLHDWGLRNFMLHSPNCATYYAICAWQVLRFWEWGITFFKPQLGMFPHPHLLSLGDSLNR